MSKNNLYKISALSCMTLMLAAFTHCVSESPTNKSTSANSSRTPSNDHYSGPTKSNGNDGGAPTGVAAVTVSTGVKDHEQILHTMSSLTGVPANNTTVLRVYNEVSSTLPTTNDVKSLAAPNQVAVVKLAAEFCNQFVETGTMRNTVFTNSIGMVNVATITLPQLMANPAARSVVVQGLIDNFWGGMISEADLAMSEQELQNLMTMLAYGDGNVATTADNEAATNAGAKKVVKGLCTAVLSSAHVTLL